MSRAIADKFDVGGILKVVTPDELKKVITIVKQTCPNTPPTLALHVYKNRGGSKKRVIIWINGDLGRGWMNTLFMTSEDYTPIQVDLVKMLKDDLLKKSIEDYLPDYQKPIEIEKTKLADMFLL